MLIAEDLLLLLLDDETGAPQSSYLSTALGGAVLVELALASYVGVEEGSRWHTAKVTPIAGAQPPADAVLAAGLATIAERPRSAQDLVNRLGKGLPESLAERLVEGGILERRDDRLLGLFPRKRWPSVDLAHEQELRRSLTAALVAGQQPDQRTAALIALLSALDRSHQSVDHDGIKAREIKRRAKEIADGDWAAAAVRDAIQAATAAMIAATTAATSAATIAST
jgi:hypothetical protein